MWVRIRYANDRNPNSNSQHYSPCLILSHIFLFSWLILLRIALLGQEIEQVQFKGKLLQISKIPRNSPRVNSSNWGKLLLFAKQREWLLFFLLPFQNIFVVFWVSTLSRGGGGGLNPPPPPPLLMRGPMGAQTMLTKQCTLGVLEMSKGDKTIGPRK